jgi:hypothetical protein
LLEQNNFDLGGEDTAHGPLPPGWCPRQPMTKKLRIKKLKKKFYSVK